MGAETDSVQIPRKIQFLRFGGDRSVWYFELCILCRCRAVIVSLKNAAFILLELALRLQSGEQLMVLSGIVYDGISCKIQLFRFGGERILWCFGLCILCRCPSKDGLLTRCACSPLWKCSVYFARALTLRLQSGEQLMAALAAGTGPAVQMLSIFWRRTNSHALWRIE